MSRLDEHTRRNRMGSDMMVEDALAGVTVSWLAQVFRMDPKTVKQRLANCPPLHRRKAGYVYSLPVVCSYLIKPAFSIDEYLKTAKPNELPNHLQQTYWDALLKRQKWEENAGDLWRTDSVREVLGQTFQTIKFTIQLWADTIERQTGLTKEQRELLETMADGLQQDIYEALVEQARNNTTPSQLSESPDASPAAEDDIAVKDLI